MENNTIFLREKKERDYTVINNAILKDTRISWKAKGLFCYLLSLPEDWNICMNDLQNRAKDGIDGLKSAVKELKEYGYLIQKRNKDEKGRFLKTVYIIVENPQVENPQVENPQVENPQVENPQVENPQLLNTNIQNTNLKNTDIQNTKRENKQFTPPILEEVADYCKERNNNIDPMQFIDYYSARGWRFNNGGKMKDWRATVRTWERRNYSNNSEHKDFFSDCDKKTF